MTRIAAVFRRIPSPPLLVPLLLLCAGAHQAIGQSAQTQPTTQSQPKPVPLRHLYLHFLIYQNFLDTKAAELASKGKDGSWLRNDLQTRLRFSDADYASVRSSSQRLASEIKALDEQVRALRTTGGSPDIDRLKALAAQHEAYIDNEIDNLNHELSPEKRAALNAFLVEFFAPKNVTFKASPPAGQSAGKAVQ